MASTTCEIAWLSYLLVDLYVLFGSATLYCDYQATIHIASYIVFHERTRHTELDCHLVYEKIHVGLIKTAYIPTNLQITNVFTKALRCAHFHDLTRKRVRPFRSPP